MFCPSCGTSNDDSSRFCRSCGAAVAGSVPTVQQAPPPPPAPYAPPPPPQQQPYYQPDPRMRGMAPAGYPNKQFATGKNPAVATIMSLIIVGLGQLYNGDVKKGAIMFVCALVAGIITLGIAWFGIAIWSAIDAYNVAAGKSPLWT
jgi:TM2 domain-containing membrane protein YozV